MIRFFAFVLLLAATTSASAQPRPAEENVPDRRDMVRVQVNISFAVPLASNDEDAIFKAQETARRRLYAVADKECALLADTIASVCRIESVNVNVNRLRQPNADSVNASLSMALRILLKP